MDQYTAQLSQLPLTSLVWGPIEDTSRPLAILLHGFPDTAHTWRHLGPVLAEAGWRVVAPYTRGYAPSGLPHDDIFHVAALMSDVMELHAALEGDHDAVLVGHDWGALTANGLAAHPRSPFARVVALSVPPVPALAPQRGDVGRWLKLLPRQAGLSWHTAFNQLPRLPERNFDRLVAHLWRRWSPGYDAAEDLRHLAASMPDEAHRTAAINYYRHTARMQRLPARYATFARHMTDAPAAPYLYLHGADDGCLDVRWVARAAAHLPADGRSAVIPDAGHFLHLEQPDVVADRILEFLEEA